MEESEKRPRAALGSASSTTNPPAPAAPPSCDAAHVSATAACEGQPAPPAPARSQACGCRAVLV